MMNDQDFEMSCQDFAAVVSDLARERMMDAGVRADGLAHAALCESCALRLADERALTSGLRAVAVQDAACGASPQVEAALLAAFRSAPAISPITIAPVHRFTATRRLQAVAAIALLALGLSALVWFSRQTRNNLPEQAVHPVITIAPEPVQSVAPVPQPVTASDKVAEKKDGAEDDSLRQVMARTGSRGTRRTAHNLAANAALPRQVDAREITSDFLPLPYGSEFLPLDGGQILRVRMPRSALSTFGLPMSRERASEPIKADVLVGYDGTARAIRFVQ